MSTFESVWLKIIHKSLAKKSTLPKLVDFEEFSFGNRKNFEAFPCTVLGALQIDITLPISDKSICIRSIDHNHPIKILGWGWGCPIWHRSQRNSSTFFFSTLDLIKKNVKCQKNAARSFVNRHLFPKVCSNFTTQ